MVPSGYGGSSVHVLGVQSFRYKHPRLERILHPLHYISEDTTTSSSAHAHHSSSSLSSMPKTLSHDATSLLVTRNTRRIQTYIQHVYNAYLDIPHLYLTHLSSNISHLQQSSLCEKNAIVMAPACHASPSAQYSLRSRPLQTQPTVTQQTLHV
ncbi:hypothetical protein BCR34DRAFT_210328 [Clohesyomyces aquaticus]|uniref:Uncharacterized protein n=1 Tax=Clohesyomyces aquaticus TaxID=1231657 RepID=A0A1Y2A9X9_9PLEO|nr:hypothetical protein BCR34DRAFT_210328 [Clohesyomyces aquaticus]